MQIFADITPDQVNAILDFASEGNGYQRPQFGPFGFA